MDVRHCVGAHHAVPGQQRRDFPHRCAAPALLAGRAAQSKGVVVHRGLTARSCDSRRAAALFYRAATQQGAGDDHLWAATATAQPLRRAVDTLHIRPCRLHKNKPCTGRNGWQVCRQTARRTTCLQVAPGLSVSAQSTATLHKHLRAELCYDAGRTRISLRETGETFSCVPPNSKAHNVVVGRTWVDCCGLSISLTLIRALSN